MAVVKIVQRQKFDRNGCSLTDDSPHEITCALTPEATLNELYDAALSTLSSGPRGDRVGKALDAAMDAYEAFVSSAWVMDPR